MTAWSSGNALSHHEPAVCLGQIYQAQFIALCPFRLNLSVQLIRTAAGTAALPALEKTALEICGRGAQEAGLVSAVPRALN